MKTDLSTYQVLFAMDDDDGTIIEVKARRRPIAVDTAIEQYRQRRGDGPDMLYAIEDVRKLTLVAPPTRPFRRPRRWETFDRLFAPIERDDDGAIMWEPFEVPKDADARFWWTLIDCDGRLLLGAGFHIVNRLGYVLCRNGWDGEWSNHAEYYY